MARLLIPGAKPKLMFTPTSKGFFVVGAALALASCGKSNDEALKAAEQDAAQEAADDGKVECALAGSADFRRVCTTDRIAGRDGQILVLRHPDGGFRRFKVLTDGRGLAPAEGFDETHIKVIEGGFIEVTSSDDRYRLPATIKADEAAPAKTAG